MEGLQKTEFASFFWCPKIDRKSIKKVGPKNKRVFDEFLGKKLNINVKIDAVSVAQNVSAHAI